MKAKHRPVNFENPDDSPGFLMWQVSNLWQKRMNASLRELGLTHVQFILLASIHWLNQTNEEPVTQVMLAAHAKTDVMMTSKVVRTLEQKGFVTRQPHPTDTRANALSLTHDGYHLLLNAINIVNRVDTEFFEQLNGSLDKLRSTLVTLVEHNRPVGQHHHP